MNVCPSPDISNLSFSDLGTSGYSVSFVLLSDPGALRVLLEVLPVDEAILSEVFVWSSSVAVDVVVELIGELGVCTPRYSSSAMVCLDL